ncbi:phosphopantetheine-binding protein [Veronia pacifica]|uniref:Carrier domain-containing protein n=1 Tax=Veronia pacifica TaxID=1080227 RepID=A0A1C3EIK3_9GAMM|nr:phosphopantetheine-binding protein [Veronia pacifica]ODA33060.1 hypothetical protein A8L45_11485 [Veronia pacifica]
MFSVIVEIISKIKNDPSLIKIATPESHLIEDLNLDSLDIIDFLLELEVAFDLKFDFDKIDFSMMESIHALQAFIEQEKERSATA